MGLQPLLAVVNDASPLYRLGIASVQHQEIHSSSTVILCGFGLNVNLLYCYQYSLLAEWIALHTLKPLKTKKPFLAEGLFWSLGCD